MLTTTLHVYSDRSTNRLFAPSDLATADALKAPVGSEVERGTDPVGGAVSSLSVAAVSVWLAGRDRLSGTVDPRVTMDTYRL